MVEKTLLALRPNIHEIYRVEHARLDFGVFKKHAKRSHDGLIYVLRGDATYDFGNYSISVHEGDLFYLPKDSLYIISVSSPAFVSIYADFAFGIEEGITLRAESFHAYDGRRNENLLHKMHAIWHTHPLTAKEDCLSMLYTIYSNFLTAAAASLYISPIKRRHMTDAKAYIHAHLSENALSVPEIAKAVGLSETQLRKTFQELYNMSPSKYISMTRINLAKEKVRYTALPFAEIAEMFGFANVYYFSTVFKKEIGCTPSEYRKNYKSEIP